MTIPSALHFGNMEYIPEPLQVIPVTGGSMKDIMPKFRHALSRDQHVEMLLDDSDTRPIKTFYPEKPNAIG